MKKFKTKAYRITNRTNEVCDRKGSIKKGKEVILCGSQWTSQHIKHWVLKLHAVLSLKFYKFNYLIY